MSDVRWEGLTHTEIYAQVRQGPGRGASADAEAAWTTVGDTIRGVHAQLTRAVRQIGVDWQGRAADAAHGGMTAMGAWALDAADNATLTTDGVAAQAAGAQHVRDAMPPPRQDLDTAVALVGAGGYAPRAVNVGALEDQMAEDRAYAVDLMNRYTSDSSTHQEMMNYWTQPPSVVVEAVASGPAPARPGITAGAAAGLGATAGRGPGAAGHAAVGPGSRVGAPAASPVTAPVVGPAAAPPPEPVGGAVAPGPTAGRPTPHPALPGDPTAADTTGRTPAPPPIPGIPGGAAPGSPASRGRTPDAGPPGGVRRVVPGVPARPGVGGAPGDLEAPWRTPATRLPGPGGTAEPGVPRTGLGDVPAEPGQRGRGIGGSAEDAVAARPVERLSAPGPGTTGSGHGILPLGGAVGRAADQEHRRAGYLVDDTDAFADDRWFTPPVIGADDLVARRG